MAPGEVDGKALDVKRFKGVAVAALVGLERAGVGHLNTSLWGREPSVDDALNALAAVGCLSGRASEPGSGETASLTLNVFDGGYLNDNLAAEAVEAEAKEDNCRKLRGFPDAEHRHLAVYIDPSQGSTFSAVSGGDVGRLPLFPEPITTAWIAAGGSHIYETTSDGWERHSIPLEVIEHPERWIDE